MGKYVPNTARAHPRIPPTETCAANPRLGGAGRVGLPGCCCGNKNVSLESWVYCMGKQSTCDVCSILPL